MNGLLNDVMRVAGAGSSRQGKSTGVKGTQQCGVGRRRVPTPATATSPDPSAKGPAWAWLMGPLCLSDQGPTDRHGDAADPLPHPPSKNLGATPREGHGQHLQRAGPSV